MEEELLSEEKYKKRKKKISVVALIILLVGLTVGGSLIANALSNKQKVNNTYSEENKQTKIESLNQKIAAEKEILESKKNELKLKGIKANHNYEEEESYDLYIITNVLDPSFAWCNFDEYKNNELTSKYCSLKKQLDEAKNLDIEHEREWHNFDSAPQLGFGIFIIIASTMISLSVFAIAKRREMLAFSVQQMMPVAQESLEKIAPSAGKAGATVVKEMAPAVGEMAEEISKGIRRGLRDNTKCPNCGALITGNTCDFCRTKIDSDD